MLNTYWNKYELYLIRNIENACSGHFARQLMKEQLQCYYTFISKVGLSPYIMYLSNDDIIPNYRNDDVCLWERYYKLFKEMEGQVRCGERNKLISQITRIVKENGSRVVDSLNNMVVQLLNIDEGFKLRLMSNQLSS